MVKWKKEEEVKPEKKEEEEEKEDNEGKEEEEKGEEKEHGKKRRNTKEENTAVDMLVHTGLSEGAILSSIKYEEKASIDQYFSPPTARQSQGWQEKSSTMLCEETVWKFYRKETRTVTIASLRR